MIPAWADPTSVTSSPFTMAALVAIGALIGTVGGLFGISGCFLLTPILMDVLGIREGYAIGSASCHAVGIAATGLRRHLRYGQIHYKLGFAIAAGALLGSSCGSVTFSVLERMWDAPNQQIYLKVTIRAVLLAVLAFVALLIARPPKSESVEPILQRIKLGPMWAVPGEAGEMFSLPGAIALAFACGIVAGFLGLGGGVVYMPMLILALGMEPVNAVRVSLLIVLCSAVGGTAVHGWAGRVSLTIAILLIAGSSLGVQLGAHICQKVHGRRIRKWFALIVVGTMGLVVWKLIRLVTG